MKFNVPGKDFAAQLQAVSKVLNAKNALSIYDNLLLTLDGQKLLITGSDQEIYVHSSLDVFDSDEEGSVAVNAKKILEITKEVASQPLTFEVNPVNLNVTLSFPSGKFEFPALDGAEFPKKKEEDLEKTSLILPADVVRKGIENTIFAVSAEMIRPIMTGILWDVKKDSVIFVSSDTHKLVRYTNSETQPGLELRFILPQKPAGIIRSLISSDDTEVNLSVDAKSAEFSFGRYTLSCRLIKGNYPDYNRVIPQRNPFSLTTDRDDLLTATRRVAISASQSSKLIKMAIDDAGIRLSSADLDYSTSAEEAVGCTYEGSPMTIGFKSDYMREVLSNLKGDSVRIELSDPARPGLFMPSEQLENEEIVMLQMPMQVLE